MSIHGKATSVLLGGMNVSPFLNSVEVSENVDVAETTGFQANAKTYVVGMDDATASFGGRFQGDASAMQVMIDEQIATEASPVCAVGWGMGLKRGNPVLFGKTLHTSASASSSTSDVVSLSGELLFDAGVFSGVYADDLHLHTATASRPTYDRGAATTGDVAVALFVTENTRNGASTFRLQHSTDGTVWTDLVTFAAVAATDVEAQLVTLDAQLVNRYIRVGVTLAGTTGTARALVAFGTH